MSSFLDSDVNIVKTNPDGTPTLAKCMATKAPCMPPAEIYYQKIKSSSFIAHVFLRVLRCKERLILVPTNEQLRISYFFCFLSVAPGTTTAVSIAFEPDNYHRLMPAGLMFSLLMEMELETPQIDLYGTRALEIHMITF